jgi:hypothetical protein
MKKCQKRGYLLKKIQHKIKTLSLFFEVMYAYF